MKPCNVPMRITAPKFCHSEQGKHAPFAQKAWENDLEDYSLLK